ncbi:nephronectin a isoform X2 [Clupea harengus]|uniref:Nephronectin a isoform X2 n=1 Tax=Clupea harengus TaxID=7950 RepID=A0A6P8G095_CLUHA|nr:nephronectin a isoform X2 [Clupea harengus]
MERDLILWTDWYLKCMFLCTCLFSANSEFDGRWPTQTASSSGLCRYAGRLDCCWGWTRHSWGHCQPVCHPGCKHGQCAGPNKCKCDPGFTGKTCNQDVHICAMANCQYGCDMVRGDVHCQCPSPGLHLAPDGRTCVDIDECAAGLAVCPRFHRCMNTFGSYICKCFEGFAMQFINGKHQCKAIPKVIIEPPRPRKTPPNNNGKKLPDADLTRITTSQSPVTSPTKAKSPSTTATTAAPPQRRKTITHKPPVPTRQHQRPTLKTPLVFTPNPHLRPWRPPFSFTKAPSRTPKVNPTQWPPTSPDTSLDNRISKDFTPKQRGDVHIPRKPGQGNGLGFDFDVELGNTEEEMGDDPEAGVLSCSFDYGLCGWIKHGEGDTQWAITEYPSGGKYLTLPEVTVKHSGRGAQLILPPLSPLRSLDFMCLSFQHKLAGHHVGMLQVFVEKGRQHSPAMWGRMGGSGWSSAQITLWGNKLERIIIKGERRRYRQGEIALDDISLRRGRCSEEHRN